MRPSEIAARGCRLPPRDQAPSTASIFLAESWRSRRARRHYPTYAERAGDYLRRRGFSERTGGLAQFGRVLWHSPGPNIGPYGAPKWP